MTAMNTAPALPGASGDEDSAGAMAALARHVEAWGRELGFAAVGIGEVEVAEASGHLARWLAAGRHGTMDYMARHAGVRADPSQLLPGVVRVISARMDYLPVATDADWVEREQARLREGGAAVVSLYARGRDYHKVLRQRLQQLADRIALAAGPFGYRVCTDSAPLFEVELARRAGLGWRGKHTLLLTREAGSMFFLGEILTDLPLPASEHPADEHCGTCTRCIEACPTGAITAPYQLDARRCISYLTIEHDGSIPEPLRAAIGNRIYGCDDCQLACPWNKFAGRAALPDFDVRNGLDSATLVALSAWSEQAFDQRHAGSAIRRIGHTRWLRNIAVALGNAPTSPPVIAALERLAAHPHQMVREHAGWALAQHRRDAAAALS
jgi:epoxyqueuosine reductase